jgi:hypothetical protein
VAKALSITDEDFIVAAKTLAELVPQEKLEGGCCYPDLSNIREVTQTIAAAVAKHIFETGRSDRKDICGSGGEDWLKCRGEDIDFRSDRFSTKQMSNEPNYWNFSDSTNILGEYMLTRDMQLSYIEKITALYRFYLADSVVGHWKAFVRSIYKVRSDLFHERISSVAYKKFVDECKLKVGFDIVLLLENTESIGSFEQSMTIQEQMDFIRDMEQYQFQPDFKCFTDVMVKQLTSISTFRFFPGIFKAV